MNWRLIPGNAEGKNGKEVFCKLADFVVVFLWTANTKGEIDFLNQSWWNYTGQSREKSPQRAWLDCLEPSDAEAYLERWGQAVKNKNPFQIEVRVRRYDGSVRWMLAAGYPWMEGAILKGYVGSCSDVTARKSIADSCFPEESLRQIKRLVDNSPAVLLRRRVDSGWPVDFVSESISQFGVTRDQMVFGDIDYASLIHADDLFHVEQEVRRRLDAGQERLQMEYRIVRPDGSFAWVDDRTVVEKDANGRVVFLQTVILDCTQRRQAEEQLKYLSLHDPLTGLFTRQYFEQEMTRLAEGTPSSLGIILCDLDGMKLVNDSLGHQSGDELLVAAAQTIKGCFSNGTTVARIGGDEFAVLMPKSSRPMVESACARIRDAVATYNVQHNGVVMGLSIGLAVATDDSRTVYDLFKEADNHIFREKLRNSQTTQNAIVNVLVKAMDEKDFVTEGHADRIQDLVASVAIDCGLSEHRVRASRKLAQFHDIGKVGIPEQILFKPGPLNERERNVMQKHCQIGHNIAQSAMDLIPLADGILKHHEWWNGEGYPLGLKGDEIPVECRILSIADAYDAMTSDRPYRQGMQHEAAIREIQRCSGTQFDPVLVEKFVRLADERFQQ